LRPPPCSPPSPYTTLFRSIWHPDLNRPQSALSQPIAVCLDLVARWSGTTWRWHAAIHPLLGGGTRFERAALHVTIPRPVMARVSDRKSTRLNSSHVKISYA